MDHRRETTNTDGLEVRRQSFKVGRVARIGVDVIKRQLPLPIGIDRPIILATGDGVVPGASLAETVLQVLQRPGLPIGAGLDASGVRLEQVRVGNWQIVQAPIHRGVGGAVDASAA